MGDCVQVSLLGNLENTNRGRCLDLLSVDNGDCSPQELIGVLSWVGP